MNITASYAEAISLSLDRYHVFSTPGLYVGKSNGYVYWCITPEVVMACLSTVSPRSIGKESVIKKVDQLPDQEYTIYFKAIQLILSN